jgi:hypothetical protein
LRRLLERKQEATLRQSIDEAIGSAAAGEKNGVMIFQFKDFSPDHVTRTAI